MKDPQEPRYEEIPASADHMLLEIGLFMSVLSPLVCKERA